MNCPAKTDPIVSDGHNQNPDSLCSDLTTRNDLGRIANARLQREHRLSDPQISGEGEAIPQPPSDDKNLHTRKAEMVVTTGTQEENGACAGKTETTNTASHSRGFGWKMPRDYYWKRPVAKSLGVVRTYSKFVGPGFMIAVVSAKLYHQGCFDAQDSRRASRHTLTRETTQLTWQPELATASSSCS